MQVSVACTFALTLAVGLVCGAGCSEGDGQITRFEGQGGTGSKCPEGTHEPTAEEKDAIQKAINALGAMATTAADAGLRADLPAISAWTTC